jgi:hypothetical protein
MCIVENLEEWEEDNREEEDETPHEFATPGSFTVEGGVVIGSGSLKEDSAALTEQLQAIAQSLNKENK